MGKFIMLESNNNTKSSLVVSFLSYTDFSTLGSHLPFRGGSATPFCPDCMSNINILWAVPFMA